MRLTVLTFTAGSVLPKIYGSLNLLARVGAFRSRCQLHRKRESRHCVSGCKTLRSGLHCGLRLARRTTSDLNPRIAWERVK